MSNKKYIQEFVSDSYKSQKYKKKERFAHVIVTYDLNNASSTAYKEIDEHLRNRNFSKKIKFKPTKDSRGFDLVGLPKNTYTAFAMSDDYKNINKLRDGAERIVRSILDEQIEYGDIDGYNYFVFTAKEWSFAVGEKYREEKWGI